MVGPRLKTYLDTQRIAYRAVSCKIDDGDGDAGVEGDGPPAREGAPVVAVSTWVLAVGEGYVLLVLPRGRSPSLTWLSREREGVCYRLASEAEIEHLFPDCDQASIPPCGEPYGVPVYASDELAAEPALLCPAGRVDTWLHLDRAAFDRLAQPRWMTLPCETSNGDRL